MITKRYKLVNNIGGWLVFAIALLTYWLTLEPTASYWDCGEFIIQADKLEVGHPPGNPIFMLTARFFANFAPSAQYVSVMVNAMSGLLSAFTILLLFWSITHLARRLLVKDDHEGEISLAKFIAIMGSGVAGALAYTWSDTFWFSAVEGEVYAFSSFCTALVFWLILKWENHADEPHSDRYLILIAYIIGVSVAVHLLNLLCIPAIVLVFCYRKWKDMNLVKSLIALLVSFAIIVLVLYGLVPGFIKVAQQFELFFVNTCGMGFNSGALVYACLTVGVFAWAIYSLYSQKSANAIRVSVLCALAVSGIFWIGSVWVSVVLLVAVAALFWTRYKTMLPVRVLSVVMWSIAVIFVGYSSYALILIRSTADTPMNQNSPDNVFDLASYLSREQYGENPLIYGETLYSSPMKRLRTQYVDSVVQRDDGSWVTIVTPYYDPIITPGKALYAKGVKGGEPSSEYGFLDEGEIRSNASLAARGGDYYVKRDYKPQSKMNPELNMLFPRIYSRQHRDMYGQWVRLDTMPDNLKTLEAVDQNGGRIPELDTQAQPIYNEYTGTLAYPQKQAFKPSFAQNLAYFFNYQLNHMYMRYFLWNFAGRQNDINNQQGELDAGNWISGIPFIDNARLGDQSLLPEDLGKGNAGHNVYFMLPLILGLLGLVWQSFEGRRGIEQFWVVFFLFFMTGVAIVLYLNQTPGQPRERDYAFAGSFYAFAIWIGLGVAALWKLLERTRLKSEYCAAIAALLGLCVPLQMVSQTWDDHDRSGRYAARDYAVNYLESLEPNAIVFCNGDNDTFPLWYAQEVEGVRPDVKIINLSYLNSDWYANQQRMQSYDAPPVAFTAKPENYAYGNADVTLLGKETAPADLLQSLKAIYSGAGKTQDMPYASFPSGTVTIPVDRAKVIERGLVAPSDTAAIVDQIVINLAQAPAYRQKGYISLGELLMLDIIATNAANGWERPIYWASTVGNEYHLGLTPYLRSTGMTHQLVPTVQQDMATRPDRAYDVITKKYRWGGADVAPEKAPYFDETVRRMLVTVRTSMVDLASQLVYEGDLLRGQGKTAEARKEYAKALEVLRLMEKKLPDSSAPYTLSVALTAAQIYCELGSKDMLGKPELTKRGLDMLLGLMDRYGAYVAYNRSMAFSFGNPSLTYESQLIPYQYYRMIELYADYGGDESKIKPILAKWQLSEDELKKNYDRYTGNAPAGEDEMTPEEFAAEIAKYCEIANEMASLSAEDYAARSADEKMVDSALYSVIQYYLSEGGTEEELRKYPNYRSLDMERSRRLSEEASR
ncbi:MAG: DUF2723 domain-containing protein [Muribaculaceae bacterium]|nr:DUF2723 domain-containing protein [Muribaculaceae bacterium]